MPPVGPDGQPLAPGGFGAPPPGGQRLPPPPPPAPRPGPPRGVPNRVLFVDIGEKQPTSEELQDAFTPYGLVEKINAKVSQDQGRFHCFVQYTSVRAASRVAQKGYIQIGTCGLRCVRFSNKPCPDGPSQYDRPGTHIWAGFGARDDLGQDDVGVTFSQFGDVQSVEMHKGSAGNSYAVVTFCQEDAAVEAYNAQPKVKGTDSFCEWFHPGEPLSSAPAAAPPVAIVPALDRTVVLKLPASCVMMDDDIADRLKRFGPVEEVAMALDDEKKQANVVFSTTAAAKECYEAGKSGALFDDVECTVELPAAVTASAGAVGAAAAPLAITGGSNSALKCVPAAAAAAAVASAVDTPELCLTFGSVQLAQMLNEGSVKDLFVQSGAAGVETVRMRDRFALITFADAVCAKAAKQLCKEGGIKVAGDPVVVFARKGVLDSLLSAPAPEPPKAKPESVMGNQLVTTAPNTVSLPGAGCITVPGGIPWQPSGVGLGGQPLQAAKSNSPPACEELKRMIDSIAAEYAETGIESEEAKMVLQTDNAPYLRYKVDTIRIGVTDASADALAKMRAVAAQRPEGDGGPDHLSQYAREGEIPFAPGSSILLLGEGDFSFARGLCQRLGGGAGICATTVLTKEETAEKYPLATEAAAMVVAFGGEVAYGFDACQKQCYEHLSKMGKEFSAVVLNYPCALGDDGTDDTDAEENSRLLRKVFKYVPLVIESRARIYITVLAGPQLQTWKPSRACLAADTGLRLINRFRFRRGEYPGYVPQLPAGDPCAAYRTSWTLVFGKKKKYDPFDEIEEREVALERIRDGRRRKRRRDRDRDSSPSRSRRRRRSPSRKRDRSRDRDRRDRRRR
eukprot:TRINITY_DN6951_c0_g1_i1.p1 TRINITY_DN6951_c0_g1~~TRINITY_DN6951_c0_g1_i1.p1  ORF type:complete len:953 (+),score=281.08 TRINITY_DN6951_c0_g1_i1:314-2860(+)